MPRKCATHHRACDCRERAFAELLAAADAYILSKESQPSAELTRLINATVAIEKANENY